MKVKIVADKEAREKFSFAEIKYVPGVYTPIGASVLANLRVVVYLPPYGPPYGDFKRPYGDFKRFTIIENSIQKLDEDIWSHYRFIKSGPLTITFSNE